MKRSASLISLAVLLFAAAFLASKARPPAQKGEMAIHEFAKLPAVHQGRLKPLDTLARVSLMIISDRQSFRDEHGEKQPAIRWLLDVMSAMGTGETKANAYWVFRIENDQLLDFLGLEPRTGADVEHSDQRFRYAIDEFRDKMEAFAEQAERARDVKEAGQTLTLFQRKILELAEQVTVYVNLARLEAPHLIPPATADGEWKPYSQIDEDVRQVAFASLRSEFPGGMADLEKMSSEQIAELQSKLLRELSRARADANPAYTMLTGMLTAYRDGRADEFNSLLDEYKGHLASLPGVGDADVQRAGFEVFFNRFAPFDNCLVLYLLAGLIACFAWLGFEKPLNRAAFQLLLLVLVVHTLALVARMYLQGRPPITNLYSTAIFIGWGCVVMGLILERIHHNGIGNAVAGVTGFLSLLIADKLAASGDTLEMMQAVLDTNFWLATHVTVINAGYAATFMAGFLAILFVLRGVFTTSLDKQVLQTLGRMIYGCVCFATLLSFTGTVLGGIWADYSWGRFWGWDPKENGALMIVLWNALILHARWGGMVRQRGMAVLAIFGNVVTAWSWFGVNMLSVGLHSYGFMSSTVPWLLAFVASQLGLIALGMLPTHAWRSWRSFALPAATGGAPRLAHQMDPNRERDG
jgi:ABC-type transport system involved in cytochrome c biogenesis permease subunit